VGVHRRHSRWRRISDETDGRADQGGRGPGWRIDVGQLTASGLTQWLLETTGAGVLQIPKHRTSNWIGPAGPAASNPMSYWRVARQAEVRDVLVATLPWLIVKRERALMIVQLLTGGST
jgi:hypothetical protein